MDAGKKFAIGGTLLAIVAVGVRVGLIYKERHEDVKPVKVESAPIDPDWNVFLKKERPDSMKDAKGLKGRTLWVSAASQMDYYLYKGGKVDYAKSQGVLLGAEPIVVKDAVEATAPKTATFRIPGGDKQVLLVFNKPGAATDYAVPVGYREGTTYTFETDNIFFYDDPHTLYSFWGPAIWKAIDEHKVIPFMTEHEAQLALGQVFKPGKGEEGDRTLDFDNLGHPISVTFVKNRATSITPE